MLTSGNGQHRRPRQAPRFVVTMGATGAGIALPLLATGAAHAASNGTWDRVAACETGSVWSADNDGFYGGLALTQNVWDQFGGDAYAERADLASRQQQIAVAQKLLDAQGATYWTGCAVRAGLAQGGATPDVDPGATPSGNGSAATDHGLVGGLLGAITAPPAAPSSAPSSSASPTSSPSPTSPLSSPSATSTGAPSTGAAGAPGSPSVAPSTGRHARPPVVGAGDPVGTIRPRGAHAAPQPIAPDETEVPLYTVRPGDDLVGIATKHAVPGGWRALYAANRSEIGADASLIRPGEQLDLG